jgi:hypothetical protein
MPKSLQHQIAANTRWSKEDPTRQGEILRAGLEQRFLDEVDPDHQLPEAERIRRAECARKAFYQRLALKSAQARKARKRELDQIAAQLRSGGDAA